MSSSKQIFVCVDFGMTGSSTRWRNNEPKASWSTEEEKIPTKLSYDSSGNLTGWGRCARDGEGDDLVECWKSYQLTNDNINYSDRPGAPASQLILKKWILDFLSALCNETAERIDASGDSRNDGWRDRTVVWNFTVPGSWPQLPVAANFHRLAKKAVFSILLPSDKIRINTDISKGKAASMCLVSSETISKIHKFAVGDVVISCDIGGATTDIAFVTVASAGKLDPGSQSKGQPEGITSIDKAFWELARSTLRKAGIPSSNDLAWRISQQPSFAQARTKFRADKSDGNEPYVEIRFPGGRMVDDWPVGEPEGEKCFIKHNVLNIHRDVFESIYQDLLQQIETAIDDAFIKLTSRSRSPTLFLCGGGSRNLYLMDNLKNRYTDIIGPDQLTIKPEMATVIGSTLAFDSNELHRYLEATRFGMWSNGVLTIGEEQDNSSSFEAPACVVTFSCSSRSMSEKHSIFAIPHDTPGGKKDIPAVQGSHGLPEWVVEVDLRDKKGGIISRKRKYTIFFKILALGKFEVEVRSMSGKDIPVRLTEPASD